MKSNSALSTSGVICPNTLALCIASWYNEDIIYHLTRMSDHMKKRIAKLLDTKMNRKDFLKYAASTGLMLAGGNMILNSINSFDKLTNKPKVASKPQAGYGASAYGGSSSQKS